MERYNAGEIRAIEVRKHRLLGDGIHEQRYQKISAVAYGSSRYMPLPVLDRKQRFAIGNALRRPSAIGNVVRCNPIKGCGKEERDQDNEEQKGVKKRVKPALALCSAVPQP